MAHKKAQKSQKSSPKSMNDVTKPGQTPAQPTSRPVIIGHTAELAQDPMVAIEDAAAKTTPVVQPLAVKVEEKIIETPPENELPVEESTEDPTPAEETAEDEGPKESSAAAVEAVASEVSAKREAEKENEADLKRVAELEEVIASRKYFVPVGEVSKRRMTRLIVGMLLVLLVLLAVGINFAIDGDMLDIGIKPLTDIL